MAVLEGRATAEIDGVRHDGPGPSDATRTLVETGETRRVAAEHARPPIAAGERP